MDYPLGADLDLGHHHYRRRRRPHRCRHYDYDDHHYHWWSNWEQITNLNHHHFHHQYIISWVTTLTLVRRILKMVRGTTWKAVNICFHQVRFTGYAQVHAKTDIDGVK